MRRRPPARALRLPRPSARSAFPAASARWRRCTPARAGRAAGSASRARRRRACPSRKQFVERHVARYARLFGARLCGRRRVDDRRQRARRALLDGTHVREADIAGAGNGDAGFVHAGVSKSCLRKARARRNHRRSSSDQWHGQLIDQWPCIRPHAAPPDETPRPPARPACPTPSASRFAPAFVREAQERRQALAVDELVGEAPSPKTLGGTGGNSPRRLADVALTTTSKRWSGKILIARSRRRCRASRTARAVAVPSRSCGSR